MTPQSLHFIVFLKLFIYFHLFNFWLHWVFVALQGLSLLAVSRGCSSLWVRRLVASLVAKHQLQERGLQ